MTINPLIIANVRHLYFNEGLNMRQIQAATSVSYNWIRKKIKGIPFKKNNFFAKINF